MSFRDLVNKNQSLVTLLAIVLLFVALFYMYRTIMGPGHRSGQAKAFYYDLNTGEIFIKASGDLPPIEAPSGALKEASGDLPAGENAGLRAIVFACGDCGNKDDQFVAWVEYYPPESQARIEEMKDLGPMGMMKGKGTDPTGQPWPPIGSEMVQVPKMMSMVDPQNPRNMGWVWSNDPRSRLVRQSGLQRKCDDNSTPRPCTP